METANKLAIVAIVLGLRRTGAIDRQAVKDIAAALSSFSQESMPHCMRTAADLDDLASMLIDGPLKSCFMSAPTRLFESSEFCAPSAAADRHRLSS